MSQERYLQIKKEHQVRKFVGRFLFILLAILDVLLVSSHSNYVPLVTVAMVTIVPFNHFLLGPLRRQKKAIEKEHPEWKKLSTKGVKVPSAEANKRTLAGIGILIALLLSFGIFYKPVKQPNNQVNKPPKVDSKTSETSKPSESESSSSSKTKESSSSESKSSSSTGERYHIKICERFERKTVKRKIRRVDSRASMSLLEELVLGLYCIK